VGALEAELERAKAKNEKTVDTWKNRASKLRETMKEKEAAWKTERATMSTFAGDDGDGGGVSEEAVADLKAEHTSAQNELQQRVDALQLCLDDATAAAAEGAASPKSLETWKNRAAKLRDTLKEKEAGWKTERAALVEAAAAATSDGFEIVDSSSGVLATKSTSSTPKEKKKVLVSGCFDLLHSGHIEFFREAAEYGELYVRIGTDANIRALKAHETMYSDAERLFMVRNIKWVHDAALSAGSGRFDFKTDMEMIQPDIYICNDDASGMDKRVEICEELGIEMVVPVRKAADGLEARSSTSMKARLRDMVHEEEEQQQQQQQQPLEQLQKTGDDDSDGDAAAEAMRVQTLRVQVLDAEVKVLTVQIEKVTAAKEKAVGTWKDRAKKLREALNQEKEKTAGATGEGTKATEDGTKSAAGLQVEREKVAALEVQLTQAKAQAVQAQADAAALAGDSEGADMAAELQKQRKRSAMALKKASAERDSLRDELEAVKAQVVVAEEETKAHKAALERGVEGAGVMVEAATGQLVEQLKSATTRLVESEADAFEKGETLKTLTAEVEEANSSKEKEVTKWKARAEKLRTAVKESEQKLQDSTVSQKELADASSLEAQRAKEAKVAKDAAMGAEVESLQAELEERKTEAAEAAAAAKMKVANLKTERAALKEQLKKMASDSATEKLEEELAAAKMLPFMLFPRWVCTRVDLLPQCHIPIVKFIKR
jgi:cytidyltransferase-like protein